MLRPLTALHCPCPYPCHSIFAECHDLIPPSLFFSACVRDACQVGHPGVPCQSLEAYAALCRARGACSDWRNATGGLCGELGAAAGGPGLLGPPDTHLCPQSSPAHPRRCTRRVAPCSPRPATSGEHQPDCRRSGSARRGQDPWGALPPPDLPPWPHGMSRAADQPCPCSLSPLPWMPVHMGAGPRTASPPHRTQSPDSTGLAEGCFCPDGQTLFNSHTDVCVPECRKHTLAGALTQSWRGGRGKHRRDIPVPGLCGARPASMSVAASAQRQPVCQQPLGSKRSRPAPARLPAATRPGALGSQWLLFPGAGGVGGRQRLGSGQALEDLSLRPVASATSRELQDPP